MRKYTDFYCVASVCGYSAFVGYPESHHPEDLVVGVDEEQLAGFFGQRHFAVGKDVADKFGAMSHAEGL